MEKKKKANLRTSAALLAALLTFLTGCQPLVLAPPLPTLETVRVQFTPALQKGGLEQLQSCARQNSGIGLILEKVPAQALDISSVDISARIGFPAASRDFAADLGKMEIKVISNPSLSLTSLIVADLAAIYTGKTREWSGETSLPIQVWTYLPGDDLRQAFEELVLNGEKPLKEINQAPDPGAMIEAVRETPGALGFIPSDWLNADVQSISLDHPLSVHVIGLTSAEPRGAARQLVACLQE